MKTIKLYGKLGDTFGRTFKFDVKSPAEAIRMLQANFKNFNKYMLENSEPGYHIFVAKDSIGENDLSTPVSDNEVIKIVPVIAGSGSNPYVRIVIGAVLLWASSGTYGYEWIAPALASMGTSLILGGVSQILFAPPDASGGSKDQQNTKNAPSYSFDGAVNTTRQGNPVAVGYGRLRVGSQVISAGIFSEAI